MTKEYIYPDLLFSYWIFLWYILYKLNIFKYNPFILFCIAVTIVLFSTFNAFYKNKDKSKFRNIILYVIINLFIKIIPSIDLYRFKTTYIDIIVMIVISIIYFIYVYIRTGYSAIKLYSKGSIDNIINGETPAVHAINKIFFTN